MLITVTHYGVNKTDSPDTSSTLTQMHWNYLVLKRQPMWVTLRRKGKVLIGVKKQLSIAKIY